MRNLFSSLELVVFGSSLRFFAADALWRSPDLVRLFSVFSFSPPSSHGAWARCETKGKQELSGSSFWVAGMVGFECVRVNRNFCGSPHWVSVEILLRPVGAAKAACKKMHKFSFSSPFFLRSGHVFKTCSQATQDFNVLWAER